MARGRDRFGNSAGMGLFYCGMGIIVASAILNVAHDRLSGRGLEILPPALENMYTISGKLGVTATLVSAGLSFILLGMAMQRHIKKKRARAAAMSLGNMPYFTPADGEEAAAESSGQGAMALRTWKYLPPPTLSGTTGWATRQVPQQSEQPQQSQQPAQQ
jgi:hypothetical protein